VLIGLLPEKLPLMTRTEEAIQNPLFRFLEREVTVASGLLKTVHRDLEYLKEMCEGNRKSTNMLRQIAESIHSEKVPIRWNIYKGADISATAWLNDFVKRVKQLMRLQSSGDFGKSGLWFGGLLYPEAYLTATR
jgi:dynein heavy chain 1